MCNKNINGSSCREEKNTVTCLTSHLNGFILLALAGDQQVPILADTPGSHLGEWLLHHICLCHMEYLLGRVCVQRLCLRNQLD